MSSDTPRSDAPPAEASESDLPPGTPTGSATASAVAAAQAVGARRPLDLGQGGPITPSAGEATVPLEAGSTGGTLSPAFDAHHPPDAALVGDCVHCGFCLPTCPTYVLWGEEMDSPRGRIDIMNMALQGEPLTDSSVRHLDQCLGCMACVTACPSGVQYDKLIEAARGQIERRYPRTRTDRALRSAIYALFPFPRRLRAVRGPLRAYQASRFGNLLRRTGVLARLPEPLQAMESLAPRLGPMRTLPERSAARGTRRGVVGLLTGCVQGAFFPDVNEATLRVLVAEGCDVVVPAQQGCCGALSFHGGREGEALGFAKHVIEVFEEAEVDSVVVNAAGCGSTLKEYGHLLRDEAGGWAERAEALAAKVRDVTELLAGLGPAAHRNPLPMNVAYQDACHLAHAQGVRDQPRALLNAIPGVELRALVEAEICCGSAGVYNVLHPEPARELGERKARAVLDTGADIMVTANPGCWMQVATTLDRMGQRVPVAHTIQVLDASIRGVDVDRLLADALDGAGTPVPHRRSRDAQATS